MSRQSFSGNAEDGWTDERRSSFAPQRETIRAKVKQFCAKIYICARSRGYVFFSHRTIARLLVAAKLRIPSLCDLILVSTMSDRRGEIRRVYISGRTDIFAFAEDSEKRETLFHGRSSLTVTLSPPRETSTVMRHCRVTRRASGNATVVHHCRGNIEFKKHPHYSPRTMAVRTNGGRIRTRTTTRRYSRRSNDSPVDE